MVAKVEQINAIPIYDEALWQASPTKVLVGVLKQKCHSKLKCFILWWWWERGIFFGISPAILGSRSASSAEAAAHETLGKRYTPATFDSSRLLILGREKRLTTFMYSPTI